MTVGVRVEGAARLRRTLADAAHTLADLTIPGRAAAEEISRRARPRAPRLTGTLANSITPTATTHEADVASRVRYAPFVHNGTRTPTRAARPFLTDAVQPADVLKHYADHVDDALDQIKGL